MDDLSFEHEFTFDEYIEELACAEGTTPQECARAHGWRYREA